jgi:hypothetical protein
MQSLKLFQVYSTIDDLDCETFDHLDYETNLRVRWVMQHGTRKLFGAGGSLGIPVERYVAKLRAAAPQLRGKRISPHVIRHSGIGDVGSRANAEGVRGLVPEAGCDGFLRSLYPHRYVAQDARRRQLSWPVVLPHRGMLPWRILLPHERCSHCLMVACAFFLALALSFVRPRRRLSSAPTVDFARRRAQEAVKVGRRSAIEAHSDIFRPRLDSFEHGGRLDDHGPEKSWVVEFGPFVFRSLVLCERLLNELRTRSLAISRRHAFNRRCKVRS